MTTSKRKLLMLITLSMISIYEKVLSHIIDQMTKSGCYFVAYYFVPSFPDLAISSNIIYLKLNCNFYAVACNTTYDITHGDGERDR